MSRPTVVSAPLPSPAPADADGVPVDQTATVDRGSPPLSFRRVEVRRFSGFESGGFVIDDLSPGVNVLFGPNGCGKSRTAAAMNLLLWPNPAAARRASLGASFELGGSVWRVDLDAGAVRFQCDGAAADAPPSLLPSPDVRDRYNLPLQDLLGDDHDDFAETILRESAGGYDLRKAVEELGFRSTASAPASLKKDTDALKAAEQDRLDAERQQDAVREEERRLAELAEAKARAKAAAVGVDVLGKALSFHEASEAFTLAQQRVAEYPPGVALLKGDEWKTHRELTNELSAARTACDAAERDYRAADEERRGCRFPDEGLAQEFVPTVIHGREDLTKFLHQADARATEQAAAEAERMSARAKIAPALSDEQLSRVVAGGIEPFAQLARKAETARAEVAADEALSQWLAQASSGGEGGANLNVLQEGVRQLQRWLAEPPDTATEASRPDGLPRLLVFVAAAVLVVVAVVLAIAVHLAWAILAAGGVGLTVPLVLRRRVPATVASVEPAGASRSTYARDFSQLPLPQPADWSTDDVRSLLSQLTQQWAARQVDQEKATRWANLAPRCAQRQALVQDLTRTREALAAKLGVAPATEETAMSLLAANVLAWQDAGRRAAAAAAVTAKARADVDRELAAAAAALGPFGYSVPDAARLHAAIEDLRSREQSFKRSTAKRGEAGARLAEAKRQAARLDGKLANLFTAAGLDDGNARALQDWCERYPACYRAVEALKLARRDLDNAAAALPASHQALKTAPRASIEADLNEARNEAATLEAVQEEIGRINARVQAAKGRDDVEAALCRRAESADSLRQRRSGDCAAAAGWVLSEYLKRETRDTHRPAVFRSARTLFQRITQGRWRLEFDDEDPPAFRATETSTGTGHALDELSSGTRLQLLLAVRVAFVEQQERGARLPLFFDETLANSDEQRARAIIEAAIELSRAGRQVFYLTAQPDEVGKWKSILDSTQGVPYRLIDLAEVRGLAEQDRLPLRELAELPDFAPPPPPPDGATYEQYGRLLKVPDFNIRADSAAAAHLWHLLDDPAALHELLRRGLCNWGQLREFRESPLVADLAEPCARAEAAARALQVMADSWRVGRGRRIDREAIEESGAVSPAFEPQVSRLLEAVEHDAQRLLHGLETKQVPGFRDQKAEQLRQYLREHGYLDERPKLTGEDIRLRVLGALAAEVRAGLIDVARINRYVATWCTEVCG